MERPIWQKMEIKRGQRAIYINTPVEAIKAIEAPDIIVMTDLDGLFDYVHLFTKTQLDMNEHFPMLKEHLTSAGALWVSWPKGGQLGTDLNIKHVIRIGDEHGLVESINLRIDDVWTALKFTWPKPIKEYHNSYGRLPNHT